MPKADSVHRVIAKFIDFLIVGFVSSMSPFFGSLAGAIYIMIGDGFFNGQSVGKKFLKLQVKVIDEEREMRPCGFKDSIIRNLPFSVFIVLHGIPVIGVVFLFLGIVFCALELYFVLNDHKGIRVGDIYAETQVVNEEKNNLEVSV
ncbi:MAG TPA: RDD family protein [Oligoflexia bacterium]|nr:RDD family protein [Oligoflexia bacterium]HMR24423.1 RDD family protein [Oligoflexia bacterium]